MSKNKIIFHKKELVIAVSLVIAGGVMSGCGSSNGSDGSGVGGAGSYTLQANGGVGGNTGSGQGGDGGELYIYNAGTSGGVEVSTNGSASTDFTTPNLPTVADLGDNPLVISSDTTIETPVLYTVIADATAANPVLVAGDLYVGDDSVLRSSLEGGNTNYAADTVVADGSFYRSSANSTELYQAIGSDEIADLAPAGMGYFRVNNTRIYQTDADDTNSDVTYSGLSVAEGSTLIVSSASGCNATINVNSDIDNNGQIVKAELDSCNLTLNSNYYFASGDVSNNGGSDSDAGSIIINANNGINNSGDMSANGFTEANDSDIQGGNGGYIELNADSFIVNSGQLSAMGGDGDGGGNGGEIYVSNTPSYFENRGALNVAGGNHVAATQSSGGSGGSVYLVANIVLNNTSDASINTNGGNGDQGGSAGSISMEQGSSEGAILNAGSLVANGGVGSTADGGNGGSIQLNTNGAQLQNTGDLTAMGGDTNDGELSSRGGNGGYLDFFTGDTNTGTGELIVSGNLNVNGGNAPAVGNSAGGDAGTINLTNNVSNVTDDRMALLGYSSIELNGGDGLQGGRGTGSGSVDIGTDYYSSFNGVAAGSVSNNVPINARGGNSSATGDDVGQGGRGGRINFYTANSSSISALNVSMTNSANIDISGGTSFGAAPVQVLTKGREIVLRSHTSGFDGRGGSIDMYSYHELTNSGDINANAGANGGTRNNGGYVSMYSDGSVTNSGAVSANGTEGGDGGGIEIYGDLELTNSGSLSVNGGGTVDNVAVIGGNGGTIDLFTGSLSNPISTGSFSYSFGSSEAGNGVEGCTRVNFVTEGNCDNNLFDVRIGGRE